MSDNITIKIDPEGEAIAFIHDTPCSNDDYVMSYQHIGQHGEAHVMYMGLECTSVLYPQEIIKAHALVMELKSIGYDIGE